MFMWGAVLNLSLLFASVASFSVEEEAGKATVTDVQAWLSSFLREHQAPEDGLKMDPAPAPGAEGGDMAAHEKMHSMMSMGMGVSAMSAMGMSAHGMMPSSMMSMAMSMGMMATAHMGMGMDEPDRFPAMSSVVDRCVTFATLYNEGDFAGLQGLYTSDAVVTLTDPLQFITGSAISGLFANIGMPSMHLVPYKVMMTDGYKILELGQVFTPGAEGPRYQVTWVYQNGNWYIESDIFPLPEPFLMASPFTLSLDKVKTAAMALLEQGQGTTNPTAGYTFDSVASIDRLLYVHYSLPETTLGPMSSTCDRAFFCEEQSYFLCPGNVLTSTQLRMWAHDAAVGPDTTPTLIYDKRPNMVYTEMLVDLLSVPYVGVLGANGTVMHGITTNIVERRRRRRRRQRFGYNGDVVLHMASPGHSWAIPAENSYTFMVFEHSHTVDFASVEAIQAIFSAPNSIGLPGVTNAFDLVLSHMGLSSADLVAVNWASGTGSIGSKVSLEQEPGAAIFGMTGFAPGCDAVDPTGEGVEMMSSDACVAPDSTCTSFAADTFTYTASLSYTDGNCTNMTSDPAWQVPPTTLTKPIGACTTNVVGHTVIFECEGQGKVLEHVYWDGISPGGTPGVCMGAPMHTMTQDNGCTFHGWGHMLMTWDGWCM